MEIYSSGGVSINWMDVQKLPERFSGGPAVAPQHEGSQKELTGISAGKLKDIDGIESQAEPAR
jgi:hypothetical protein